MPFPELSTARLRLRAWRESDFEPHIVWEADPRVNKFLPFPNAPRTEEAARAQIARFLETPSDQRLAWVRKEANRSEPWWAVEVTGVADVIGGIGLSTDTFESDFTPCVEIGWRFAPAFWGNGYATEAAKAVLRYGFAEMGLDEIVSFSAVGNNRSFAVMQRIGLHYVKDFANPALPEDHRLQPFSLYKLTRAEWAEKRAAS